MAAWTSELTPTTPAAPITPINLIVIIAACVLAYKCIVTIITVIKISYAPLIVHAYEPWAGIAINNGRAILAQVGPAEPYIRYIGHKVIIEMPSRRVARVLTCVCHYDTLADYITGESWDAVAPSARSATGAAIAYMRIQNSGVRVFAAQQIRDLGGVTALIFE
jgi:hypothetical protein